MISTYLAYLDSHMIAKYADLMKVVGVEKPKILAIMGCARAVEGLEFCF